MFFFVFVGLKKGLNFDFLKKNLNAKEQEPVVRVLAKAKADLNIKDNKRNTPLHIATNKQVCFLLKFFFFNFNMFLIIILIVDSNCFTIGCKWGFVISF